MPKLKDLFSTPKKAAVSIACILVALATAGVCIAYAAGAFRPMETQREEGTEIGGEAARSFAFVDAGVDPADASAVSVKYAHWEGQFVYEVEFLAGGTEYFYKINALDGSVVNKETRTVKGPDASAPAAGGITLEQAREIALADAGVEREQASFTRAELDEDGGRSVYAFEFYAGSVEYDYEIDAGTGALYSKGVTTYVGQGPGGAVPPSAPVYSAPPAGSAGGPPAATASQPPVYSAPPATASPRPSGGIAPPSSAITPPSPSF